MIPEKVTNALNELIRATLCDYADGSQRTAVESAINEAIEEAAKRPSLAAKLRARGFKPPPENYVPGFTTVQTSYKDLVGSGPIPNGYIKMGGNTDILMHSLKWVEVRINGVPRCRVQGQYMLMGLRPGDRIEWVDTPDNYVKLEEIAK